MASGKGTAFDGRKVLLGAAATVAVGIAAATTVLVSNAMTLGNVAGRPIAARPMVLPAAPTPTTTGAAVTAHPATEPSPEPVAQVVPAPAPRAVTVRPSAAPQPAPTPLASAAESAVIAHFLTDGDWDVVLDWVSAQGWSTERAMRWVDRLRAQQELSGVTPVVGAGTSEAPGRTGSRSHRKHPRIPAGSQEDQSAVPPNGAD